MGLKPYLKRILNSRSGFSLTEMLVTVIILMFVSSIVALGVPVVKNAYEKVVLASNAEVLLSTTMSTLRSELGTANDIKLSTASGETKETIIDYYSLTRGASSRIYLGATANKEIMFIRYYSNDGLSGSYDAIELVAPKTTLSSRKGLDDLYVSYSYVEYSNGIITFNGLSVKRESDTEGLATRDSFSIRVISYKKDSE